MRTTSVAGMAVALCLALAPAGWAGSEGPSFHLTHAPGLTEVACPTTQVKCAFLDLLEAFRNWRTTRSGPATPLPSEDPESAALRWARGRFPGGEARVSASRELDHRLCEVPTREVSLVVRPEGGGTERMRVFVAARKGAWEVSRP